MHYFSCSGGPDAISIKSAPGHITSNLCFCIWYDLRVRKCIPVRLGCETSMHYFSCSGWPGTVSIKSKPRHVTLNLCFYIGFDLHIMWCILVRDLKRRRTILHARVGSVWIRQNAHRDMLFQTSVFVSSGCGSCSAFCSIWGMKHRRTIFYDQVGSVWFA
jgi:hypothetical protein